MTANRVFRNSIPRKSGFQNTVCEVHARRRKPDLMANRITPHEARTIAAAAFCDPRSVVKAIEGKPLAALTLTRIKNALAQLGRADLLPGPTNHSTPQQVA